jgi:hypothetical protein
MFLAVVVWRFGARDRGKPRTSRDATELTCDLNISIMCFGIELHNTAVSIGIHNVLELPESISGEVVTYKGNGQQDRRLL